MAAEDLPDALAAAVPFQVQLRTDFRQVRSRSGLLIAGPSGFGEFAPFDDYPDWAAARWLGSALEAAFARWPAARRQSIACNAIIPDLPVAETAQAARHAVRDLGCTVLKVKVGGAGGLARDVARIEAIGEVLDDALGADQGLLRLDANAAWDADAAVTALMAITAVARGRVDFVEQPCGTPAAMQVVRDRVGVRVAADELVRWATNPRDDRLIDEVRACADVVILKAAPLGGVQAAMDVAVAYGLPVVVSGSLDSSIGLGPGIALAAALDVAAACGLGTGTLLATDLLDVPLVPQRGHLPVLRSIPDRRALQAATAAVTPEKARRLQARLRGAWQAASNDDRARWRELLR